MAGMAKTIRRNAHRKIQGLFDRGIHFRMLDSSDMGTNRDLTQDEAQAALEDWKEWSKRSGHADHLDGQKIVDGVPCDVELLWLSWHSNRTLEVWLTKPRMTAREAAKRVQPAA